MALTEIPSELSSTPSIVDNGNGTAITIGSDESATFAGTLAVTGTVTADSNLLIGQTTTSPTNVNGTIAYGGVDAGIIYLQRQTGTDQLRFYTGGNRLGFVNTANSTLTLGTANFPLVFKTDDTERMRLSGGNLLVGKATDAFGTAGIALRGTVADFIRDGGTPINVNRLTSDGGLIDFHKVGTVVGSIQSRAGVVSTIILDPRTNGVGLTGTATAVIPTNNTGVLSNAAMDIGGSGYAFKDLYLSGGVNFSANANAGGMTSELLDDYEEGDFTLVVSGGTTAGTNSGGNVGGRYTKIGRLVTCNVVVANTTLSGASGELRLTGFPFVPSNYGNRPPIGVVRMYKHDLAPQSSGYFAPTMEVVHGANYAVFVQTKDNDTWGVVQVDNQSGLYYEGTITYTTA